MNFSFVQNLHGIMGFNGLSFLKEVIVNNVNVFNW